MQKWEYLFVTVEGERTKDSFSEAYGKYHFLINGKQHGDDQTSDELDERRLQIAERLGDEGWELVSASHSNIDMIFKRPK